MSETLTLPIDERESQVLEAIHRHDGDSSEVAGAVTGDSVHPAPEHPTQRDIAHAVGLSLGMTNAILKRLASKGFVTMQRINGRNIHYLVTPSGIDLIAKKSYRYLRRTVGNIVRYKEKLRAWLSEQAADGATTVVLVGESDLDFLVEWCAEVLGLTFCRAEGDRENVREEAGTIILLSEKTDAIGTEDHVVSLTNLLIGKP